MLSRRIRGAGLATIAKPTHATRRRIGSLECQGEEETHRMGSHAVSCASASPARLRTIPPGRDRGRDIGQRVRGWWRVSAKYAGCSGCRRRYSTMGGSLLLSDAAAGRTAVLGAVLRTNQGSGCARSGALSRPKRVRSLGLRPLRLHRTPGTKAGEIRGFVPGKTSRTRRRVTRVTFPPPRRLL